MAAAPYLIAYLAAGLLLSCGFLINQRAKPGKAVLAALVITALWPLFAFAAPETFFKSDPDAQSKEKPDPLSSELAKLLEDQADSLDHSLVEKLRLTARSGEQSVTYFGVPGNLSGVLDAFWDENIPPSLYYELRSARAALQEERREPYSGPLFSLAEPDWYVGFSNEFLKCIAKADGKLRGKILDAIGKLSTAPLDSVGNTIKPLTANLSGMWRYRIGDDRLVYLPNLSTRRITLLYFGARGDVYRRIPGQRP